MKNNYYILKNGKLIRKANTIYFLSKKEEKREIIRNGLSGADFYEENEAEESPVESDDLSNSSEFEKRAIPVEKIGAIYLYGRVSLTSGVISFFSKKQIPLHFFGYYGHYESTLLPKEALLSGEMHVRQAAQYIDERKRLGLARMFVDGCSQNILKNLNYYINQGRDVGAEAEEIKLEISRLGECRRISELMASEGHIHSLYYGTFDRIMPSGPSFEERTRRPPGNQMNAMISFGNSLVYGATINALYHTQLDQTISFLHEPSERRFSLSLDISEIFKPLLVDRTIFSLVNKGMITENDFEQDLASCLLSEQGRRKFVTAFDEKMKTTIKHRNLKRNVSYQRLIYLECIKVAKHCMEISEYKPFVIWW